MITTSPSFKQNAHDALQDAGLQKALAFSKPSFMARRTAAGARLPEFEALRDIGIHSVGQRLAVLKAVYALKLAQNVPVEEGHYVPPCAYSLASTTARSP